MVTSDMDKLVKKLREVAPKPVKQVIKKEEEKFVGPVKPKKKSKKKTSSVTPKKIPKEGPVKGFETSDMGELITKLEDIKPKPLKTKEPVPVTRQKIIASVDVVDKTDTLKPNETVYVTWEKPSGEKVKVGVRTENLQSFQKDVTDVHKGRIVEIKKQDDTLVFKQPTQEEWKTSVQKANIQYVEEKRHYDKLQYLQSGEVPNKFREQVNVPEQIRNLGLGERYIQLSFEVSVGLKEENEANRELQFEMNNRMDVEWAKQNLLFDNPLTKKVEEKPWSELKKDEPALYLEKTGQGFQVNYDPLKWKQEQDVKHEGDIGYAIGSFLSSVFSPERVTIAYEQLAYGMVGKPSDITKHHKRMDELLSVGQYEYSKAIDKGDILTVAGRLISSPVLSVPISFGIGRSLALAGQTAVGGKKLVQVGKHIITPSKILAGKIVVTGSTLIGVDLYKTYTDTGIEGLRHKVGQLGLVIPLHIMAARAGARYTPKKTLVGREYSVTTKQSFQVLGTQKYVNVFGKRVLYGKFEPLAHRLYTKTQIGSLSKQPTSLIPKTSIVKPTGPAITSLTQFKGPQKITYDVLTSKYIVGKTPVSVSMKPFPKYDFKEGKYIFSKTIFKPSVKTVKTMDDILFKTKEIDLAKKMIGKPVQTKITEFPKVKGKIFAPVIAGKEVISTLLEPTPVLKGTKPIIPREKIKKVERPSEPLKWTKTDEKKLKTINENARKTLETYKPGKIYTLKDVIKPTVQTKLIPKQIFTKSKPFPKYDFEKREYLYKPEKKEPPDKKVMTLEDIYKKQSKESKEIFLKRGKPVKTKQTSLDKLYRVSADVVLFTITKQPSSKPFKYKPVTEKKFEKVTLGENLKIFLEKPKTTTVKKETIGDYYKPPSGEKPFGIEPVEPFYVPKKGRIKYIDTYEYMSDYWKDVAPGTKHAPVLQVGVSSVTPFKIKDIDITGSQLLNMLQAQGVIQQLKPQQTSKNIQKNILKTDIIQNVLTGVDTNVLQVTGQAQVLTPTLAQVQLLKLTSLQTSTLKGITVKKKTRIREDKKGVLDINKILRKEETGYIVSVKKRKYKDGKRIRGDEYYKVSPHALNLLDAYSLGAEIIGKTEKATFVVTPVESKPKKLRRKVAPWHDVMHQYNSYDGKVVEKSEYRINSRGELENITYKGHKARRKGKGNRKKKKVKNNSINIKNFIKRGVKI